MPRSKAAQPTLLGRAARDGVATLLFTYFLSLTLELSQRLAPVLGLSPAGTGMALLVGVLLAMIPLCSWLGGALYNPANNATLYAVGKGDFTEHVVRAVGQCVGGVFGVLLSQATLPFSWQKGFPSLAVGMRQGVDIFEAATCEFVLGMLLAFAVLYSEDLQSRFWQLWLPMVATVLAVRAGTNYSGPSLNPAVTFAWELLYQQQSRTEHVFVFWAAPLAAGLMGGWSYLGMRDFMAYKQKTKRD